MYCCLNVVNVLKKAKWPKALLYNKDLYKLRIRIYTHVKYIETEYEAITSICYQINSYILCVKNVHFLYIHCFYILYIKCIFSEMQVTLFG